MKRVTVYKMTSIALITIIAIIFGQYKLYINNLEHNASVKILRERIAREFKSQTYGIKLFHLNREMFDHEAISEHNIVDGTSIIIQCNNLCLVYFLKHINWKPKKKHHIPGTRFGHR